MNTEKNEVKLERGGGCAPLEAPRRPRRLERTRGRATCQLAQGLPMPRKSALSLPEETPFFNHLAPRQDICWGKELQCMRGRAGQARHARNPGLLQHPSQSRAARQQPLLPIGTRRRFLVLTCL